MTIFAVIVAAFLFLVTSVVSAAFVLGMFSSNGDLNPTRGVKLGWGIILGALGLVMILSGDISTVKTIIALGALPFVFVVIILVVCLIRALESIRRCNMSDLTDTILNLSVFAFLGVVVWLLIKPAKGLEARRENEK